MGKISVLFLVLSLAIISFIGYVYLNGIISQSEKELAASQEQYQQGENMLNGEHKNLWGHLAFHRT